MPTELDLSPSDFAALSLVDDIGRVVFHQGRILRLIQPESVDATRALIESPLLRELVQAGLFPRSWITEERVPGCGMIVEHAALPTLTYPFEWSFHMLKAAAKAVLAVERIAERHGYELKDCHPYNLGFEGGAPKFLDLGSFVRREPNSKGWRAREEFVQGYLYPLEIWASGNHFLAQQILASEELMPHRSYFLYRHALGRRLAPVLNWVERAYYVYYKSRLVSSYPAEELRARTPTQLAGLLDVALKLKDWGVLPFQSIDLDALEREVDDFRPQGQSTWGDYHDPLHGAESATPRFRRILELLKSLGVDSVLELGGNQGALSQLLLQASAATNVICSDVDANAVDQLFLRLQKGGAERPALDPVVLNLMTPLHPRHTRAPEARLAADAVLCLAVTHHLLLKPPFFKLDLILERIAGFTKKYAFVEFMPLGLHDGTSAPPKPAGYTKEWFRSVFAARFEILAEELLEENRYLFVGRKR